MSETTEVFKAIVWVMIFYSFAITGYTHFMPSQVLVTAESFVPSDDFSAETVSASTKNSLSSQTNLPLIDLGALVFYSGNIFIDLLLNFFTALPQIITILLSGIFLLMNIDTWIVNWIQLFLTAAYSVFSTITLINFLVSQRSKGVI